MLFNSLAFLIFFPAVTGLYFLLPHPFRWLLLLLASCAFYMAFIPVYIFILFMTILIDYFAGIQIEKAQGRGRQFWLVLSIISTCAVLFVFKYCDFFIINVNGAARVLHWNYSMKLMHIILPIGLSFHTFQSLSYVIEVYWGKQKAEHNFGIYALYVMFYPQLVAGPIERPQHLLHQFYEQHVFEYQRVADGLKLMTWGMFKKVVIADRLAIFVNHVYNRPGDFQGSTLLLATVFFAFQIYCDFSGYSDIALGSAQVMGFKLMQNFNRPYFAKSIAEFWRRWHISLSTWFKDYVYIPLGGNRVGYSRHAANLFITFLISGLWHGANWTYVIWGALHGGYIVCGLTTRAWRERLALYCGWARWPALHKTVQIGCTFALVCLSWIFFRANSLPDALFICRRIFIVLHSVPGDWLAVVFDRSFGLPRRELALAYALIAVLLGIQWIQRRTHIRDVLPKFPQPLRWAMYFTLLLSIACLGVFGQNQFIYFQF